MYRKLTFNLCSVGLFAAACYVFYYCSGKLQRWGSSVGDDVVVIGYVVTIGSCGLSLSLTYLSRADGHLTRALSRATSAASVSSLSFWTWIHLSGVIVSYSSIMR